MAFEEKVLGPKYVDHLLIESNDYIDIWKSIRPFLPDEMPWVEEGDHCVRIHEDTENYDYLTATVAFEHLKHILRYQADYWMNRIAPPGCYFGHHKADPCKIGFWRGTHEANFLFGWYIEHNGEYTTIELHPYMDDRNSLLKVRTHEEGRIHQSWLLPNGEVLVFEDIPGNYPSGGLHLYDNIEEYISDIKDIWWVNDEEYIVIYDPILEQYGFPFKDEEWDFDGVKKDGDL